MEIASSSADDNSLTSQVPIPQNELSLSADHFLTQDVDLSSSLALDTTDEDEGGEEDGGNGESEHVGKLGDGQSSSSSKSLALRNGLFSPAAIVMARKLKNNAGDLPQTQGDDTPKMVEGSSKDPFDSDHDDHFAACNDADEVLGDASETDYESDQKDNLELMSLENRRAAKMKRNQAWLARNGLASLSYLSSKQEVDEPKLKRPIDKEAIIRAQVQNWQKKEELFEGRLESLYCRYPGREEQLSTIIGQFRRVIPRQRVGSVNHESGAIPAHSESKGRATTAYEGDYGMEDGLVRFRAAPPVLWCVGPAGTGKSSVVKDVAEVMTTTSYSFSSSSTGSGESRIGGKRPIAGSAYIDCATLAPSGINVLVDSAMRQWKRTFRSRSPRTQTPARNEKSSTGGNEQRKRQKKKRYIEQQEIADKLSVAKRQKQYHIETTHESANPDTDLLSINSTDKAPDDVGDEGRSIAIQRSEADPYDESQIPITKGSRTIDIIAVDSDSDEDLGRDTILQSSPATTRSGKSGAKRVSLIGRGPLMQHRNDIELKEKKSSWPTNYTALVAFGVAMQSLFGRTTIRSRPSMSLEKDTEPNGTDFISGSKYCGVLIVDNAERLLTMHPTRLVSSTDTRTNFLSQLLLLPRELDLNLLIVVITKSTLLIHSRLDCWKKTVPYVTHGTLELALHPIQVHFGSYRNRRLMKQILLTKTGHLDADNQSDCSKPGSAITFRKSLVHSFYDTVIQTAMEAVGGDVRVLYRMAVALWPIYCTPLGPGMIKSTLKQVSQRLSTPTRDEDADAKELMQNELLQHLNSRLMKKCHGWMNTNLFGVSNSKPDSFFSISVSDSRLWKGEATELSMLPYATKCLLLAAFICQTNKPQDDKKLFTNTKTTATQRRQSGRSSSYDASPADMALSSTTWEEQRIRSLRPRSISLERILSVFVNLVGLNADESKLGLSMQVETSKQQFSLVKSSVQGTVQDLGTTPFWQSLTRLRELGLLREANSDANTKKLIELEDGSRQKMWAPLNLDSPLYCCELEYESAKLLAETVDIPLDQYLMFS